MFSHFTNAHVAIIHLLSLFFSHFFPFWLLAHIMCMNFSSVTTGSFVYETSVCIIVSLLVFFTADMYVEIRRFCQQYKLTHCQLDNINVSRFVIMQ